MRELNNMLVKTKILLAHSFICTFFVLAIIQLFALAVYGFNSIWIFLVVCIFGIAGILLEKSEQKV